MKTNSSDLSPLLQQHFNRKLLTIPAKFRENSDTLEEVFLYIEHRLKKKILKDPKRLEKYLKLEIEYRDLHGRAKAKEEELKENSTHITQGLFYRLPFSNRRNKDIFIRIRIKQRNYLFSKYGIRDNTV